MQGGVFALAAFSDEMHDLRWGTMAHACGKCVYCWSEVCKQDFGHRCKEFGGPGAPPRRKMLEDRVAKLEEEKAEQGERIQRLEEDKAELAAEVADVDNELALRLLEIMQLRQDLEDKQSENEQLSQQIAQLQPQQVRAPEQEWKKCGGRKGSSKGRPPTFPRAAMEQFLANEGLLTVQGAPQKTYVRLADFAKKSGAAPLEEERAHTLHKQQAAGGGQTPAQRQRMQANNWIRNSLKPWYRQKFHRAADLKDLGEPQPPLQRPKGLLREEFLQLYTH